MINILIVDDHVLVGEGTKAMIENETNYNVDFMEPSSQLDVVLKEKEYDIYILDLYMPNRNGLDLAKEIKSFYPKAKILMYTGHEISSVFNYLIEIGVSGFISKTCSRNQLIRYIECAINNEAVIPINLLHQLRRTRNKTVLENGVEIAFSQKEEEILGYVVKGYTNDQIAEELYMSKRNVERYLTGIFRKLNVSSRGQVISKIKELNILPQSIS